MTNKELRKRIEESDDREWLESVVVTVSFDYHNYKETFKGILPIYLFVNGQVNGWKKKENDLHEEFIQSLNFFEKIKTQLLEIIEKGRYAISWGSIDRWDTVSNLLQSKERRTPFLYNSGETIFLLDVNVRFPLFFEGAKDYIVNRVNGSAFHDRDYFAGIMLGYDFLHKGGLPLIDKMEVQQQTIQESKNDWTGYLSEVEAEFKEHVRNSSELAEGRIEDMRRKMDDHMSDVKSREDEHSKEYKKWFGNSTQEFDAFYKKAKDQRTDLETTYKELLRLKGPATYWRRRAEDLKKQAWRSLYWLIGLVVLSAGVLFSLLWITPEGMLTSFFDGDKSLAIRWSIIFITLISFLYIGIRALIKITFSSFHLARDAEEREQLTFVYLAMVQDNSIDVADRHLIMQSLFSRADTGLLKDDSSPTMPGAGGIIEKVVSK